MVTVNFSATAIFSFGLAVGIVLGIVGICVVALSVNKKKK